MELGGRHFREIRLFELNLVVKADEMICTIQKFFDVQGGEVTIVMQLFQTMLNEFDFFSIIDLHDLLVVDLALDLLDTIHVGNLLLVNPVWIVRDQSSYNESESKEDVLDNEHGDDQSRPGPLTPRAEPSQLLRGENHQEGRVHDTEG